MKKNIFNYYVRFFSMALLMGLFAVSCSDDDDSGSDSITNSGQFIIAAASSDASYLLQTDTIDEGEISIVGNGVEAESATHWLFPNNKYAYGLQYRQGSTGVCNSFVLDEEGNLEQRTAEFEMPRFTAFGTYEDYVVLGAAAATDQYASDDTEKAYPMYGITFTTVDAAQQVKQEYNLVTENLVGDGEYFTVSGFVGVNSKIYTSLCPLGISAYGISQGVVGEENEDLIAEGRDGSTSISGTLHPDVTRIAIFNGVDQFSETPTIVEDDRISYATGRYHSQYFPTICLGDDDYLYVFSNSYAKSATDSRQQTTLDAGVIRLNTSTNKFDPDYYYNIQEASDGYTFFQVWHIANNKFLMRMFDEAGDIGAVSSALGLGIFDGNTGQFTKVTGFPDLNEFGDTGSIGRFIYTENGKAYIPVTTADGAQPTVYIIDAETATATKGITVVADGGITAIGKLTN